ncbi:MAG: transglutaminase domain-containing protein [Bacteroidetes bacterium]|nr:transglutaminase domain-containing protein [Bacteroidota bacterium]
MNIRILALCMLLYSSSIYAQISKSDASLADDLKQQFPDEGVVSKSQKVVYTFDIGSNQFNQPVVTVQENTESEFMCLRQYARFQQLEFYNSFVSIDKFTKSEKLELSERKIWNPTNSYRKTSKKANTQSIVSDGIFYDDNHVAFQTFDFSGIGRKGLTEIDKSYTDSKYLTRIFFHEAFAVKEKTIEFDIPDWMEADLMEYNFDGYKIEKTQETARDKKIIRFTVTNLPKIITEPNSPGMANIYPHIIFRVKNFTNKTGKVTGFDSIQDVYNWYNFLYRQCKNDDAVLKPIINKIISKLNTDEDKIKAIYYWVQDNIRYIAYEDGYAGFIPSTIQETVKNKYGDCKAMANLLTEMLKVAGYNAHYTWIGTNHIPYGRIPSMCVDNHCISTLYYKGKEYFLDGTENYVPFGENAFRIQGKSALIEKGDVYEEKIVPITDAALHTIKTKAALTVSNDKLSGHVTVTFNGNMRKDFHQYFEMLPQNEKQSELKDLLEFGNDNVEATNIKTSNLNNRDINVTVEGDIDFQNAVNIIGNEMYAGIDFFPKGLRKYYPEENRKNGFEFRGLFTYDDEIEITIPTDRQFTDLPNNFKFDNGFVSFSGSYQVNGNKLIFKKLLSVKKEILPADKLNEWKKFLDDLKEFNSYLITIAKK